ncbi:MAG: DUF3473 domain-containing protein [Acidobacteria bacterium]|nr:MAG: DUF3473 domain-containing protein [Acidobacteriota bacterium]
MANEILMSVDVDEWYQCRWATGSDFALWPDTQTFFREYYGSNKPSGEILPLVERILELFAENEIRATFFFTGEIASFYPDLVKRVAAEGHEIASHNLVHKDYHQVALYEFTEHLKKTNGLLEDLSGQAMLGYRAPNSAVHPDMIRCLLELGLRYDSSVTPTRPFMGKFGEFTKASVNPYPLAEDSFAERGSSGLWEFPLPVFPWGKLPAGSGIMTRIAGYRYTVTALDRALETGDTVYYFHPYEIGPRPKLDGIDLRTRVFLRNLGESYFRSLKRLIERYRGRFVCGCDLLRRLQGSALSTRPTAHADP